MSPETIGVIVNGATGRMGYRQHLVRSLIAIRDEGGLELPDGTVLWPEPLLVGRSDDRLRAIAERHGLPRWPTSLDTALSDPSPPVPFDAQVTGAREAAVLAAIVAGKPRPPRKPGPAAVGRARRALRGDGRRRRIRGPGAGRGDRGADLLLLDRPRQPRGAGGDPGRRHAGQRGRRAAWLQGAGPGGHSPAGVEPRRREPGELPRAVGRGARQRGLRQCVPGAVGAVPARRSPGDAVRARPVRRGAWGAARAPRAGLGPRGAPPGGSAAGRVSARAASRDQDGATRYAA